MRTAAGLPSGVGHGLYRLPGHPAPGRDSLVATAAKVPQIVFCLLAALPMLPALRFHEPARQSPTDMGQTGWNHKP